MQAAAPEPARAAYPQDSASLASAAPKRRSKKPFAIGIAAAALLAIIGASIAFAIGGFGDGVDSKNPVAVSVSPEMQGEEAAEEAPAASIEEEAKTFWDEYKPTSSGNELRMIAARSFNEGYAWVLIGESKQGDNSTCNLVSTQLFAINTDGEVVYSLPKGSGDTKLTSIQMPAAGDYSTEETVANEVSVSDFQDGAAWVCDGSDTYLVSTEGETIWSVSQDGWAEAERLFGEGAVEEISVTTTQAIPSDETDSSGGIALVEMKVNTYEETNWYSGFLRRDGTWLMEPFDTAESSQWSSGITLERDYAYWTSGRSENSVDTYYSLIDFESGEILKNQLNGIGNDQFDTWCAFIWCEWKTEARVKRTSGLYYLHKKWWPDVDEAFNYQNSYAFCNASGEMVINLTDRYILADDDLKPEFHDGYCFLALKNDDGAKYYTIIDTEGNELFSPKKWPSGSNFDSNYLTYGYEGDGLVLVCSSSSYVGHMNREAGAMAGTVCQFMDLDGNLQEEIYANAYCYSCGYALVYTQADDASSSSQHWMFIDTEGNDAFPQT